MEDSREILQWYIQAGVDVFCSEEPVNMLQKERDDKNGINPAVNNINIGTAETVIRPATTLLAQENAAACRNAKDLCSKVQNLEELKQIVESFGGCSLKFSANSTVFGYGNHNAEVMFVGEAPGADEDRIGKPFVGRSGQLLDKMLAAINLHRDDCYISNILPWRPPGNRTPTDGEVAVCLPFLRRQIELVNPKILFLLGASAANALLENNDSISGLRGKILEYKTDMGKIIPTLASYHPAYLLRSPAQKAKAWSDLLRLRRKLNEI